ncbi:MULTISPECIES: TerD family protein [unclassified Streptomyces]|uniref:TerD family protein n=1 Tax=unclassified Streptomyces TaxID=2593676 RepID=UPI00081E0DE0|nr:MULTISPECIES: TerD family protein [unclassified Streptomyces]MYR93993.1 DNA polymerase III [Streptomyces sp. SID4937]SCD63310.1 DNA polymerase-3 subunit epsilon [Streptomyces sp. ScaeMP-e83]
MTLRSSSRDVSGPRDYAFDWALVDVETSGVIARRDRVLSVAVVTIGPDGEQTGEFSTLLNPGCDPGPVHVHGLTAERLLGAPTFEQMAGQIGALLQGRVLVAHNAQFDYDFLAHEFARARLRLPVSQRLCTLALNRQVDPPAADMKLGTLAAHYGVEQTRAHDALDDTRVLAGILRATLREAARLDLPLPLVACPPRQDTQFAPQPPKTPCVYRNPGRAEVGGPLVQGMKIAITGETATSRTELVARSVAAGLNVMSSVSRHTSALVTNEAGSGSAKARRAAAESVPVIDEHTFLRLLHDVRPGTPHQAAGAKVADTRRSSGASASGGSETIAPAPEAAVPEANAPAAVPEPRRAAPETRATAPAPDGPALAAVDAPSSPEAAVPAPRRPAPAAAPEGRRPLAGRRVLVLGGTHPAASAARTRVVELGGSAAINLSRSVTDAVLLSGGEADRRIRRLPELGLPVHDEHWLTAPEDAPAGTGTTPKAGRPSTPERPRTPLVLPRGGVVDLPGPQGAPASLWHITAAWAPQDACEIDVVAFVLDDDEQVTFDEDFVFYGAPENPAGTVRLLTDGPAEQTIAVDLASLPPASRKVAVAAAIDGEANFGDVGAVQVTAVPGTGAAPLARATLDAATTERTLLLAEFYRRGPVWRFRAVGQGYDHGLADLARGYGVDIAD